MIGNVDFSDAQEEEVTNLEPGPQNWIKIAFFFLIYHKNFKIYETKTNGN